MPRRFTRFILGCGGLLVLALVLFGLIQLIPVERTNPPVVAEPNWDRPTTRALAQRACFDCHSNETVWPAYAYVAPVSWLVAHDVTDGREHLNFSEWGVSSSGRGRREDPAEEAPEKIESGEMPPGNYLLLHPEARLTEAEQQQLIEGLMASLR